MHIRSEQSEPGRPCAAPASPVLPYPLASHPAPRLVETRDLRKRPIYVEPAVQSAYWPPSTPPRITLGLPIGTQARFIAAASAAANAGRPLNTLLTLRWTSLFSDNDVNWLRTLPVPERIDRLVKRLRKWLTRNGLPPQYIWVREAVHAEAEHWHMAFHLPRKRHSSFTTFLAGVLGEPAAKRRNPDDCSEGEFARGELGSWHLAEDTRPDRQGYFLAAYLGKGEPSQQLFRGRLRDNKRKPVRGQSFGGDQQDGKYDAEQGEILGNTFRGDRFFISKALQSLTTRPIRAQAAVASGSAKPQTRTPQDDREFYP
jgi:hypothetical protein